MDITDLILSDHHEQRRMFAMLDDIDRDDVATLSAVWTRLKILLEVHAEAEEKLFYPRLLELGTGAGGKDSASAETKTRSVITTRSATASSTPAASTPTTAIPISTCAITDLGVLRRHSLRATEWVTRPAA